MTTINVNIFDKNNVELLNEIESHQKVNDAEKALIAILANKAKSVKIIDYTATDRSVKLLKSINSNAVNTEYAFISDDNNISYIKDVTEIKAEHADIVVSINAVQRKANPVKFIREILSIHSNEVYIIFPCGNVHGMTLKDDLRIERLPNDSRFINNTYSHDTVNKIAESLHMTSEIYLSTNDDSIDYALLSFTKEKPKAETKEAKTVEVIPTPNPVANEILAIEDNKKSKK